MEFLHTDAFIRLQVVLQSVVYTHGILSFSLSLFLSFYYYYGFVVVVV